jgi:hypothetical protein
MAYDNKGGQHIVHAMYGRGLVLTDRCGGRAYGELYVEFGRYRRWVRAMNCTDTDGRLVATSR